MAKKNNEAKVKFIAETGEFNAEIEKSNSKLSEQRAELKLIEAQMKTTGTSTEGLQNKQKNLAAQLETSQRKTEALTNKLEVAERCYGENSREAEKLRTQILNARTAEERLKQELDACNKELEQQEDGFKGAGNAAKKSGEGFTVAKGIIANLASNAIQFAIDKLAEFVGWLGGLPEATREFRQDMATLETSFDSAGFTVEQATDTWKDLYTVFGEDDRAVEAANLIAKMADDQADLSDWVIITTGVMGEYQDSLPVEALAEAANETAKTGTVTGNLADALNWSTKAAEMFAEYMSEDVVTAEDAFNEALAECTSEEERQALITETLLELYGESANKFREASGAQMEAKEVAAENALIQAELAEAIEPVTTAWTGLKNELLSASLPAVKAVSGALVDTIDWLMAVPSKVSSFGSAVSREFEKAKKAVSSGIDYLKNKFNFDWSLPKIKLPHFRISGKFSLDPPSVPKFSIDWYRNGAVFLKPTIFGFNGNRPMAGGEAGPEAIAPIDTLQRYVTIAVESAMRNDNLRALAESIESLAERPAKFYLNGREFATATAGDSDNVNGMRSTLKSRGLIME